MLKRRSPSTAPSGTPLFISIQLLLEQPILTRRLLFIRYERISWHASLDTPYVCNLHKKRRWGRQSNALLRSMSIRPIYSRESNACLHFSMGLRDMLTVIMFSKCCKQTWQQLIKIVIQLIVVYPFKNLRKTWKYIHRLLISNMQAITIFIQRHQFRHLKCLGKVARLDRLIYKWRQRLGKFSGRRFYQFWREHIVTWSFLRIQLLNQFLNSTLIYSLKIKYVSDASHIPD